MIRDLAGADELADLSPVERGASSPLRPTPSCSAFAARAPPCPSLPRWPRHAGGGAPPPLYPPPSPPHRRGRPAARDDERQRLGGAHRHEDGDALRRLGGIADLFLVHYWPIATALTTDRRWSWAGRSSCADRAGTRRGAAPAPWACRAGHGLRGPPQEHLLPGHPRQGLPRPAPGGPRLFPHPLLVRGGRPGSPASSGAPPRRRPGHLHPEYASTRFALSRAREGGFPAVAVQHHHVHASPAAMAEHGVEGPALVLVWDGAGLGDDGVSWGGELLLASAAGYLRLATFRPLSLSGGDLAVRAPWRLALCALDDAFQGAAPLEALPLFRGRSASEVELVRQLIAKGVNAPKAHGAGASSTRRGPSCSRARPPVTRARSRPPSTPRSTRRRAAAPLLPRPLEHALAPRLAPALPRARAGRRGGREPGARGGALPPRAHLGGRRAGARRRGTPRPAPARPHRRVLRNRHLAEGIARELAKVLPVHLHHEVPPGDGGIALGQLVVADAKLRGESHRGILGPLDRSSPRGAVDWGERGALLPPFEESACASGFQVGCWRSTGSRRQSTSSACARWSGWTSSTSRSR